MFSDGTNTNWTATDQDGDQANNDPTQNTWHNRRIDLTSFAGKTISQINLVQESTTAAGSWDISFNDIAIVSADGTVRPLYSRQTSISLTPSGSSGVTGRMFEVLHVSGESQMPDVTTRFYHPNASRSTRLISARYGYPVWKATYLPFGEEYNPQLQTTDFKFGTYQRDQESGLDYAQQRFFTSQFKRFMSPDPLFGDISDPQSLNRYAYVENDPINAIDPTGMDGCTVFGNSADCSISFSPGGSDSSDLFFSGDDGFFGDPFGWGFPSFPIFIFIPPPPTNNPGGPSCCSGPINITYGPGDGAPSIASHATSYGDDYESYLQDFAATHKGEEPLNRDAYQLIYGNKALWQQSSMTVDKLFEYSWVPIVGPAVVGELATMGTVQVAVGNLQALGQDSIHFAWRAGGQWFHALRLGPGFTQVTTRFAQTFAEENATVIFRVPVLNPGAAMTEGCEVTNCFTAVVSAIAKGWFSW